MSRKTWTEYFMGIAHAVAERSTCNRKHVGCVLVLGRRIVATGYNGSIAGLPHCDDVDHDMVNGSCVRTVHAEMNAVAQAARFGIALDGAVAYVNTFPCWKCFQALATAGIEKIVYDSDYPTENAARVVEAARAARIQIFQFQAEGWS